LAKRYPDSKAELDAWFHEAEAAVWANPAQIKQQYGNASILKESRAVFNICGNKFRLVVKINYPYSVCVCAFRWNTPGIRWHQRDETQSN